jgi:hypothetical protein
MDEQPKLKLIYKKSLFIELVRRNHNFMYSTRNRKNEKYQVYMFEETPELIQDLIHLTRKRDDQR